MVIDGGKECLLLTHAPLARIELELLVQQNNAAYTFSRSRRAFRDYEALSTHSAALTKSRPGAN